MKKVVAGVCLLLFAARAEAFPYQESGQAVAFAMPAIAVGVALHKRDYKGIAQLAVVTGLTYGTAYALKQVIKSCRPYAKPCTHGGSGWDSMPSTTSAIASAPSSFMWGRYGWEWGLPMFVISKYPSWSMQKAKKNKLMDGLASTVLSFGFNQVFTTRYHRPGEQVFPERGWFGDVDGEDGGVGATVGYRF